MMYCDFKTVTNIIYKQLVKSSVKSYSTFINMLFDSYNASCRTSKFSDSETSKLRKGKRTPTSTWVEYYKTNDSSVMLGDISVILPLLLNKEQIQMSLYHLYCDDEYLSNEMRYSFGQKFSEQYSDDETLANLLYEVLLTAVIRHYEKNKGEETYHVVSCDEQVTEKPSVSENNFDKLFLNSEYISPCEHFCGRDEELQELHDLVKKKSKVMVVGVRSSGKSELVRAFIEKFGSEYDHIGYYNYTVEKSDGIRPQNLWNIIFRINGSSANLDSDDSEYRKNLLLLSSIGRKALIVIDNFNVSADYDKQLPDIMRLKCDVIFISHMNHDEMTVYKVRDFRRFSDAYALIKCYYPFELNDRKIESEIHRMASLTHRNPFLLNVCGKQLSKGVATPFSINSALCRKDYSSMKARISTKKDGQFQEKANYHELLAKIADLSKLTDTEKYVLSYMRFIPVTGVAKLLFAELIALNDINVIENLIDTGLIQEDKGGTVSLPSIVCDLVESDIPVKQEEFVPFAKRFFALKADSAPKTVLSEIADKISVGEYMDMYESDPFMSAHTVYRFNYKIGDVVAMYLIISVLSAYRDPDDPVKMSLYNADREILFRELDKIEGGDLLKEEVDMVDERLHSGIPLPHSRKIHISAEDAELLGLDEE